MIWGAWSFWVVQRRTATTPGASLAPASRSPVSLLRPRPGLALLNKRRGSGSWGFLPLWVCAFSPAFASEETNASWLLQCKWEQILAYPELSESCFLLCPASLSPLHKVSSFARIGQLYSREFPHPLFTAGWTLMIYLARVIKIDRGLWRKDSLSNPHLQTNWIYFAWMVINAR